MRLLLDTHAFLWFIMGDSKLSTTARNAIEDPGNEKLVSAGSIWEIAIKVSLFNHAFPPSRSFRQIAHRPGSAGNTGDCQFGRIFRSLWNQTPMVALQGHASGHLSC